MASARVPFVFGGGGNKELYAIVKRNSEECNEQKMYNGFLIISKMNSNNN